MLTNIMIGFIIIFLAGMVQGLTSFGFSLISVPLLSMFIPLKIVVPMLILYSLIINIIIFYKVREHVELKRILILIICGILATPMGTYLLLIADEKILKIAIGIIVTITAILFSLGYKFTIKKEKLSLGLVGLLSGLLNGSVSLSGPPIILFLTNQGVKKHIFRANLTSFFLILNIITIPTYLVGGLITKDVLNYTMTLFPALILGVLTGIKAADLIEEKVFKKITLLLIVFMGFLSIFSGIR